MVCGPYKGCSPHTGRLRRRSLAGLPMVSRAGSHDAQDGDDEQDGEGYVCADEDGGKDGGGDVEGGHGGVGQRGEEGDEGAGESRAHEGVEAERPDAGAGVGVGHTSPPVACLSLRRCHACLSCTWLLLSLLVTPALTRYPRPARLPC